MAKGARDDTRTRAHDHIVFRVATGRFLSSIGNREEKRDEV